MINNAFALNHFNSRPESVSIDTIILHSMYCPFPKEGQDALNPEVCINWLDHCQVSVHFIISQAGQVYQLVNPVDRAWHAGKSQMPDGRENVNDFSIGIELISPAEGDYPAKQLAALNSLIKLLRDQFPIKSILGHQDVAVKRSGSAIKDLQTLTAEEYLRASQNENKTDPWNFPWELIEKHK